MKFKENILIYAQIAKHVMRWMTILANILYCLLGTFDNNSSNIILLILIQVIYFPIAGVVIAEWKARCSESFK